MKLKIKKGAKVQVIAGADKGKKGIVIEIDPKRLLVRVEGVRVQTHFDKKDGLLQKEGFIHYSNLQLVDKAPEKKATGKKSGKSKTA